MGGGIALGPQAAVGNGRCVGERSQSDLDAGTKSGERSGELLHHYRCVQTLRAQGRIPGGEQHEPGVSANSFEAMEASVRQESLSMTRRKIPHFVRDDTGCYFESFGCAEAPREILCSEVRKEAPE